MGAHNWIDDIGMGYPCHPLPPPPFPRMQQWRATCRVHGDLVPRCIATPQRRCQHTLSSRCAQPRWSRMASPANARQALDPCMDSGEIYVSTPEETSLPMLPGICWAHTPGVHTGRLIHHVNCAQWYDYTRAKTCFWSVEIVRKRLALKYTLGHTYTTMCIQVQGTLHYTHTHTHTLNPCVMHARSAM